MCDTRLEGHSDWSPFEETESEREVNGGEVPMAEEKMVTAAEQKKGFLARLFGQQKSGGCCSVKIEEISEEEEDKAPQQVRSIGGGSSCCGPAPRVRKAGDGAS